MGMPNTIRLERLSQLLKVTKLQKKAYAKREAAKLNGTYAFFDMDFWFIKVNEKYVKEGFCSSAACVLGSAALHPWFTRKGLYIVLREKEDISTVAFKPHGISLNKKVLDKNVWGENRFSCQYGEVFYKGHKGILAGMAFFGITREEADWLFWPNTYGDGNISPARVIKRVEDVIAHYKSGIDSRVREYPK